MVPGWGWEREPAIKGQSSHHRMTSLVDMASKFLPLRRAGAGAGAH